MTDAESRAWRDLCARIADLAPGHVVRVVHSADGLIGDVLIDGESLDVWGRAALVRALPDARFADGHPSLSLTPLAEVACGAMPGRLSRALGGVWPAVPTRVRWVGIEGGEGMLAVEVRS